MSLAQIEIFECPICQTKIGPWTRGITFHAKTHGLSSQEMYDLRFNIVQRPTCACKSECNELVSWKGWDYGYSDYVIGHYSAEKRSENTTRCLLENHWAKGKSKENCETLRKSGRKVSGVLKEGFKNGRITHWAKGHTKDSHLSVKRRTEKLKGNSYHRMNSETLRSELLDRIGDRFTLSSTMEILDDRTTNRDSHVKITCTRCHSKLELSAYNIIRKSKQLCPSCDHWSSEFENDVGAYVESLGFSIDRRKMIDGCEIDITVPKLSLGIECNGLYWHSDAVQSNKRHHQNKTDVCDLAGLRLIHLFEDEWRDKQAIVQGMIRSRLGVSMKLGARSCSIRQITSVERRLFFEQNHIDGDVKASVSFGLFHDDKIVAGLSLRRPRIRSDATLEIARFATSVGLTVVGALSRLLSKAKTYAISSNVSRFLTYVDTRYGDGHAYEAVGFKLDHITDLRFWWTDKSNRFDRMVFRAKDGMSEKENAKQNHVHRVYGCVNKAYYLLIET